MQPEELTVDNLIAKIKDKSDKVRAEGWLNAWKVGAPAIKPLAAVTTSGDSNLEVARSAKRALWQIVNHFGRIEAEDKRKTILAELQALLTDEWPDAFRRDVLWMLSEIGDASSVEPISEVLKNRELLDDARCALQRIPGDVSLAALKAALESVPNRYKNHIAHALRVRGVEVDMATYPDQNLIPTKPIGPKPEVKKTT
jgi:hypothetical protein